MMLMNCGGLLILEDLYNERVTKVNASDLHDFRAGLSEEKLSLMPCLRTLSNVLFQMHCVLKQNN